MSVDAVNSSMATAVNQVYLLNGQFNATWNASVTFTGDEYEVQYNRVSE